MQKQLMILEVSQKQNYIFASRKLKDNIQRSADIARVTSSAFFEEVCPRDYDHRLNMVYSGGGHTVLQFDSKDDADRFARGVTASVLKQYPGMSLFVKQLAYAPALSAGENLNLLSKELEIKKSKRQQAFRTYALGIEVPGDAGVTDEPRDNFKIPQGWHSTPHIGNVDPDDNFLAVIHIDGNAMGARVQKIYESCGHNWSHCVQKLDQFSREIDEHFQMAFDEMADDLARELDSRVGPSDKKWRKRILPIRKIIGAGDDVCFITTGKLGLECAANFLTHLNSKQNRADGEYYTACAGVVLIHKKYPFRQAYDLSESLCRSAKRFVTEYGGGFSALDFHVEYGQIKSSLTDIRADYTTDDGKKLELRPYAVTKAIGVPAYRTYPKLMEKLKFLEDLLAKKRIARSKIKGLRVPFRQGEWETRLAMRMTSTNDILKEDNVTSAFWTDDKDVERNRYFDAMELLDVTTRWQEVSK